MASDQQRTLGDIADELTTAEAAAATRLSVKRIKEAIKRGELPAHIPGLAGMKRPGRGMSYRIRKQDLEHWYFGIPEADQ